MSGSGSNTLVFSYTVLATDSDTDGIYLYKSNPFTLESGDSIVGAVDGLAIFNEDVRQSRRTAGPQNRRHARANERRGAGRPAGER